MQFSGLFLANLVMVQDTPAQPPVPTLVPPSVVTGDTPSCMVEHSAPLEAGDNALSAFRAGKTRWSQVRCSKCILTYNIFSSQWAGVEPHSETRRV